VAAGSGDAVVMTRAGLTVNENALAEGRCRLSVTLISKCEVPAVLGWPPITPVAEFNERPFGKLPAYTAQVYDPLPPLAVSVCAYVPLASPGGRGEPVVMATGALTVSAELLMLAKAVPVEVVPAMEIW